MCIYILLIKQEKSLLYHFVQCSSVERSKGTVSSSL